MPSSRSPRSLHAVKAQLSDTQEVTESEGDPLIVAHVERTLATFQTLLPPEALAAMREDLLGFATTHPTMKDLWKRARPRPVPAASTVLPTGKGR